MINVCKTFIMTTFIHLQLTGSVATPREAWRRATQELPPRPHMPHGLHGAHGRWYLMCLFPSAYRAKRKREIGFWSRGSNRSGLVTPNLHYMAHSCHWHTLHHHFLYFQESLQEIILMCVRVCWNFNGHLRTNDTQKFSQKWKTKQQ